MDVTRPLPAEARSDARLIAWLTVVGLLSAANFYGNATESPPDNAVFQWSTVANQGTFLVILFAIMLAIAGLQHPRGMFALWRPKSIPRAIGLGAALVVAVYAFLGVTSPLLSPGKDQGLTPSGWDSGHAPQYIANFILIACIVPIVEELTFRGLGYTLLVRYGEWAAIIAVGVLFALVHGIPAGIPVFTFFGAGLAYIRNRTGSVIPGMFVHAVFNAIALIAAVTT
jgi:membrane protease YdiL (CAAX protease family)